jgi:hypothetical protein
MRPLQPHRATYTILGAGGLEAGREELAVEATGAGFQVRSSLSSEYPARLMATVDWQLDAELTTRLLVVHSRDGWGQDHELELTVTGNGLLAHRAAPDGPTQVELGWGPAASLDYLSAAFPIVMLSRAGLAPGESARMDTVQLGIEDLVPEIVPREVRRFGAPGSLRYITTVIATGHSAELLLDPSGALRSYAGLLRLDSLTEAPTK